MARAKKEAALTPEERLQAALVPDWEWPYKLPENWCWTRITVITDILNGFAFKSQHYSSAGIRIIRITNVQDGFIQDKKPVYYPLESQKEITPFILKDGDFLMSLTGNVGRVAIIDASFLPAALNQRVACLRIKSEDSVRKEYIFYFCLQKQFVSDCIKSAKGSAQLNMSTEWLKEYPIPLPPLAEQQRIVDRIESLFAKLDEAKEKAQAVVDSFETRKAAILHKAFTGELTAKWREEHDVGMESWEKYKFNELGTLERGRSKHRPRNDPKLFGGKYPFIQTGDVARSGMYITEHTQTLSEVGAEQDCQNDGIEFIDIIDDVTRIRFDVLDFEEEMADEDRKKAIVPFQLAYAVSIHKAQGLEYRSVKVVIPSSNAEKITHGIFYTAITRAKEKLKIYWSSETMQEVVAGFSIDTSRQKSLAIIKEKLKQDKNT